MPMEKMLNDEKKLMQGVMELLRAITRDELEAVCEEWRARLDLCIQKDGNDVE
jgi:hypothetical protein